MILRRRRREGQAPAARTTRITYRCLYIDLHEEMPPAGVHIGSLDFPILRKAREHTPSYPQNLVRVQEIKDAMVFRFTHGRMRVATWMDEERGIVWVCAADERDEDTYDFIIDLHEAGELLPGELDDLRESVEAIAAFPSAVREGIPRWLEEARNRPGTECEFGLPNGGSVRLYVLPGELEEVWIAIPTLKAAGGLMPRMRGLILATLQEALPDAEWEQRYDWPVGALGNHEIAHLAVR